MALARHAAQAILHDVEVLLAHAVRAGADDLPRPRGAGSLGSEERRRLADALIRAVAFTTGGEALREFIALMEGEAARFHSTEGSAAAPS